MKKIHQQSAHHPFGDTPPRWIGTSRRVSTKISPLRGSEMYYFQYYNNITPSGFNSIINCFQPPKAFGGGIIIELESLNTHKPRRGGIIIELQSLNNHKPRRGGIIIELESLNNLQPRRGGIIIDLESLNNLKPRRGGIIIDPVHPKFRNPEGVT
ncbi:MAG: hypothetical protein AB9882_06255 [Ignavibacteriaceae bacterium]